MLFEKNEVRCLNCNEHFSKSDVGVMEEGDLPICDECIYSMYKINVKYDGSMDLLEFLKKETRKCRCMHCYEGRLKLIRIEYGNPVDAYVICRNCGIDEEVEIHIEFI
ncbi:hypothetical protein [Sporosarcina sp. HYO08]|uniref:hypothetical protein n=1 Tax=Sporosarcina sp. HYO08 TaxID=1759557 RepID=UPI0007992CE7|nr:hypothetical protein [Sporosarcina sp. HYO08]KXH86922.1 hypothetical protein AU377_13315 [Sporosarcina sp. HYO08]